MSSRKSRKEQDLVKNWTKIEKSVDNYLLSEHPSEDQLPSVKTQSSANSIWIFFVVFVASVVYVYNLSPTMAVDAQGSADFFEARKATLLATVDKFNFEEKRRVKTQRLIVSMAKQQREDPPEQPLVWLLLTASRLRNEAEKLSSQLAQFARGQQVATIDAGNIKSESDLDQLISNNFAQDKSLVLKNLNQMDASLALGLYSFDDNADEKNKNKTIVLHYETDSIDIKAKTDQIVVDILTDWIRRDNTINLHENRGLMSRIGANPIILF